MPTKVQIEDAVLNFEKNWSTIKNAKKGWFTSNINLADCVRFFLNALDEAIHLAEEKFDIGSEKKEFVLEVLRRLYDSVIAKNLPYWAYPFASTIKSIVIDIIISNAIEFIVQKYKDGIWSIKVISRTGQFD